MSPLTKLLLILFALFLWSCLETQPAVLSVVDPSPSPMPLIVDTDDFHIELGPEWKMEREGDAYILNNERDLWQITIMWLRPKKKMGKAEIEKYGRDLVGFRIDAVNEMSKGKATVSEIKTVESGEGYDFSFSAMDPVSNTRMRSTTFARSQRIVTASFIKYSPFPPDDELERQLAELFSNFKLKN